MTDRQTTDGQAIAYSERERELSFIGKSVNSTRRASTDAGEKHLNVRIYLVSILHKKLQDTHFVN